MTIFIEITSQNRRIHAFVIFLFWPMPRIETRTFWVQCTLNTVLRTFLILNFLMALHAVLICHSGLGTKLKLHKKFRQLLQHFVCREFRCGITKIKINNQKFACNRVRWKVDYIEGHLQTNDLQPDTKFEYWLIQTEENREQGDIKSEKTKKNQLFNF
jgi:hypothetical protein